MHVSNGTDAKRQIPVFVCVTGVRGVHVSMWACMHGCAPAVVARGQCQVTSSTTPHLTFVAESLLTASNEYSRLAGRGARDPVVSASHHCDAPEIVRCLPPITVT